MTFIFSNNTKLEAVHQLTKTFVPFHKINHRSVVVVDGLHPHNLTLSHWKGANTLECHADTSGEIVLNAIATNLKGADSSFISATHFDIDGFVGVFALFFPELAIKYHKVLSAMARIGDFREFNPNSEFDQHALRLCCWMNTLERKEFSRPFEDKDELKNCHIKFDYFLPIFPDVLEHTERYRKEWEEELSAVMKGLTKLEIVQQEDQQSEIGLFVRKVKTPVHYYALFSETQGFDIVLTIYPKNKYELEYKYTTWVDITSRPTLPRIDLAPLKMKLNLLEKSTYQWVADKITDTGPILRLEKNKLSKADRYAHPTEREIYSSSIDEVHFKEIVIEFFEDAYSNINPKKKWTWTEMKKL